MFEGFGLNMLGISGFGGFLAWLVLVVALASAVHYSFVLLYPYLVMSVAIRRGTEMLGRNALTHNPKPTAEFRDVVRPSPDLIYSGCVFDVSEEPLYIRAGLPGTYMSLSLYGNNTDNFFRINDLEVDGTCLELLLVGPNSSVAEDGSLRVVRSPSDKGIMLFRYFACDGAEAEKVEVVRRRTVLTVWRQRKEELVSAV